MKHFVYGILLVLMIIGGIGYGIFGEKEPEFTSTEDQIQYYVNYVNNTYDLILDCNLRNKDVVMIDQFVSAMEKAMRVRPQFFRGDASQLSYNCGNAGTPAVEAYFRIGKLQDHWNGIK